jgi:hypothetical protein
VQKQIIVLSVLHSSNSRVARSVLGKSPQNKHNVVIVLLLAAAIIAIAYATELHTQLALVVAAGDQTVLPTHGCVQLRDIKLPQLPETAVNTR